MRPILIIAALFLTGPVPALATGTEERFSITRTDDGFIRTDAATGAVSKCTETAGQLVCRMAAVRAEASPRRTRSPWTRERMTLDVGPHC